MPDSGSSSAAVGEQVDVHARALAGDGHLGRPGRSWPQPWGSDTTPGRTASVTSTGASSRPDPAADLGRAAVGQAEAVGVVGVDLQGAAVLALHQHVDVVHPGVVGPHVAAPDQHHGPVHGHLEAGRQAVEIGPDAGRLSTSTRPDVGLEEAGQAGLQRPEVDAVGVGLQLGHGQPVGVGAEAVAVGTGPQHEVEQALLRRVVGHRLPDLGRVPVGDGGVGGGLQGGQQAVEEQVVHDGGVGRRPLTGGDQGQAGQDLVLADGVLVGEDRRRVVGHVAHGQAVEGQVVVAPGQGGRRREDHVGVAGGLVDVGVDGDVELEVGDGGIEPGAVRGRKDGVARPP